MLLLFEFGLCLRSMSLVLVGYLYLSLSLSLPLPLTHSLSLSQKFLSSLVSLCPPHRQSPVCSVPKFGPVSVVVFFVVVLGNVVNANAFVVVVVVFASPRFSLRFQLRFEVLSWKLEKSQTLQKMQPPSCAVQLLIGKFCACQLEIVARLSLLTWF